MKKILCMATGLLLCTFSAQNIFAAAFSGVSGADVTVSASNVSGATNITFTPSTNVNIYGTSVSTSFAAIAYHDQANQKKAGQAYGMTSDSNKMHFLDISSTAAPTSFTGTNEAAFSSWNTL
ncbi:MAG: hypothetical protein PHI97_11870 [Desulfobulbus sp.]|nr:hypothetical protein [Desulfobulbus sp.]